MTSHTAGILTDTDGIHTGIWECGTVSTIEDGMTHGTTEAIMVHGIIQDGTTHGTMEGGTIHGITVMATEDGMIHSTDTCIHITADGTEDGTHITTLIITTIT